MLERVSEVDQVSEVLSIFADYFVVVVDSPALVAFHHGSERLVEES